MKFDFEHIQKEYERICKILNSADPYVSEKTVGIHEVIRAHFLIIDYFCHEENVVIDDDSGSRGIGGIGPKNMDLLHSALYRQFISFEGKSKWSSDLEICATLLYGLIKDHPFHDANKRTAMLVSLYHLQKLKRLITIKQIEFENFIVEIAENSLEKYRKYKHYKERHKDDFEILFIADFLKRNSRELNKKQYTVTYRELNRILRRFNCELLNPRGNYIDVVRYEKTRKYFGGLIGPEKIVPVRKSQIGFPGWTRPVGQNAMKEVRNALNLTPGYGIDSETFFKDADSMNALIEEYSVPLRRLADR